MSDKLYVPHFNPTNKPANIRAREDEPMTKTRLLAFVAEIFALSEDSK